MTPSHSHGCIAAGPCLAVVEYEKLAGAQTIPEEFVLRPLYGRGREIWVSDDAAHLHSTPDRQLRECLWRFM